MQDYFDFHISISQFTFVCHSSGHFLKPAWRYELPGYHLIWTLQDLPFLFCDAFDDEFDKVNFSLNISFIQRCVTICISRILIFSHGKNIHRCLINPFFGIGSLDFHISDYIVSLLFVNIIHFLRQWTLQSLPDFTIAKSLCNLKSSFAILNVRVSTRTPY